MCQTKQCHIFSSHKSHQFEELLVTEAALNHHQQQPVAVWRGNDKLLWYLAMKVIILSYLELTLLLVQTWALGLPCLCSACSSRVCPFRRNHHCKSVQSSFAWSPLSYDETFPDGSGLFSDGSSPIHSAMKGFEYETYHMLLSSVSISYPSCTPALQHCH